MGYDFINRWRSHHDNSFKDTVADYWRKVSKLSTKRGTRGTQDTISVKSDPTADYRRKPYTASGDYGDLMGSVSRGSIQDKYLEPFSNRDKPYQSDGDYQEMEQYQPTPLGFSFYNLPDFKRPVPNNTEVEVWAPGVTSGGGCAISLHAPLYCTGDVEGNPNIFQSINPGKAGLSELQWRVQIKGGSSETTEYSNWTVYNNWDLSGTVRPLKIHPPANGWSPAYNAPECTKHLPQHEVLVEMVDGAGNVCQSKIKVFCRGECGECCTSDGYVEMTFNDANTSDTIEKNSSIEVYVSDGCGPFTFATSSTGYNFEGVASYETENRHATLFCADGTCESDYAASCDLTVTDNCGTVVGATISNKDCCCISGDYIAMTLDTDNTPETIAAGGSASIYVLNGCGPYTYAVSGTGYTWNSNGLTTLVSNNLNEQLDCATDAGGACGVDYDAVATIQVTDACDTEVNHSLRNTDPHFDWVVDECILGSCGTIPTYTYEGDPVGTYKYIIGTKTGSKPWTECVEPDSVTLLASYTSWGFDSGLVQCIDPGYVQIGPYIVRLFLVTRYIWSCP